MKHKMRMDLELKLGNAAISSCYESRNIEVLLRKAKKDMVDLESMIYGGKHGKYRPKGAGIDDREN